MSTFIYLQNNINKNKKDERGYTDETISTSYDHQTLKGAQKYSFESKGLVSFIDIFHLTKT